MTLKKIKEELRVRSIKNGSVIDHITAGNALNVLKILDIIGTTKAIVSVAMNVTSKRLPYGRKDIVKIEDRELSPAEVDKIALIAPQATINIIRDYEVVQKKLSCFAKCNHSRRSVPQPKLYIQQRRTRLFKV